MSVDQSDALFSTEPRQPAGTAQVEARPPTEYRNLLLIATQLFGHHSRFVQAGKYRPKAVAGA
jgi:hypothetical protein